VSETGTVAAALARVADRLSVRFAGTINPPTIERCLFEAYVDLDRTATVCTHLLALAAPAAAHQLSDQAHDEPSQTPLPRVLFLCANNAGLTLKAGPSTTSTWPM